MFWIKGVALLFLLAAQGSLAQTMYKCQNAGKIEYSDRPCEGVEVRRIAADGGPTPEDRARAQMRVAAEQARLSTHERQSAAFPYQNAGPAAGRETSGVFDPDNEKVTTHGSSGWDRKPRGQIAAEKKAIEDARERAASGQPPPSNGASQSGKAWESEKTLVHSQSGWDKKTRGEVVADKASQAYRAERNRIESSSALDLTPANIASCDSGGCSDTNGQRYNGTGSTLVRTDGKTCQRVGTILQCN